MSDERELERLRRRVEELEQQVAELSVDARRLAALLASDVLCAMVLNAETRPLRVSIGWEKKWGVPEAAMTGSGWRQIDDPKGEAFNLRGLHERVLAGETVVWPLISYDPQENDLVKTGRALRWFRVTQCPVRDASGTVVEIMQVEHDVSDLHGIQTQNEALLAEQRELEASLRQQNQELAEKIAFIEAQQRAINELSVPVIQVWEGILVLPVVGMVDDARAERILAGLLDSITQRSARRVIIDITGVPALDATAANALLRAVAASRLVGAECTLSGVSPRIAQTLITLDMELGALETVGTLEEGLKRALRRLEATPGRAQKGR